MSAPLCVTNAGARDYGCSPSAIALQGTLGRFQRQQQLTDERNVTV
jgi:hypothetical protein